MSFTDTVEAFDVVEYMTQFGAVRKSGPTNFVVGSCPICGDTRGKFYINASGKKNNGAWQSHCCHDQGGLVRLVELVEEISRYEAMDFIRAEVEGEEITVVPLVEASAVAEAAQAIVEPAKAPAMSLPSQLYLPAPETPYIASGKLSCLGDRGISQYIIDRHHLRITGGGTCYGTNDLGYPERRKDLDNRLVIPVFGPDGELMSWQARDMLGVQNRKYVFPAGDTSADTFYGWHDAKELETVLIVEGVFAKWSWDSLGRDLGNRAVERFAVASFGKKLSIAQEALLMASPVRRVIIGWDLDAASQISKIAMRLNGRKEILVMPAHPSGRDHDELTISERVDLLASAVPATMDLLIRMNAGTKLLS